MITLKVDACSYDELVANGQRVTKGEYLGFSPYFDDQLVLSPIDGTIECVSFDSEEQALCISIRPISRHEGPTALNLPGVHSPQLALG